MRPIRAARLAPRALVCLAALLVTLLLAAALPAQSDTTQARVRAERQRLEQIRRERSQLEERMRQLRGTVHDLSEEVANLDREKEITARMVRALDAQLTAITTEVDEATTELADKEAELGDKRAEMRRRLVDIYKRGPLYSYQVLLSSRSFGQLVSRYKYLHLLALRDRGLVTRVQSLRDQVRRQRTNLVRMKEDVEFTRGEKAQEEERLRALRGERSQSLAQTRRQAQQTEERLRRIARDEQRLTSVIATLEAARRRAESAAPNAPRGTSTLKTSDLGRLDWPVEGTILYSFGRVVNPNNTTTRWNGIGIGAAAGTAVRSIASGTVVVAEPFGTYGLTVIIQHGGGDYSVYGSLQSIAVQKGAVVSKGQTIGTVGSADPEMGAHLHFEIRPQGRAVDPLEWLRGRR